MYELLLLFSLMTMRLFPRKLYVDDIFLVSNRILLYYDLLLIVTAVFNRRNKSLEFIGILGWKYRIYILFIPLEDRIGRQDIWKLQELCFEN